jgi:LPXTG-motif cell wall-anchored protein
MAETAPLAAAAQLVATTLPSTGEPVAALVLGLAGLGGVGLVLRRLGRRAR